MKRSTRNLPGNPFVAWTELAWKIGELAMASTQVIAHRTARMATAGPLPDARDRREFARMGQEKFEAATESGHAIMTHMTTMNLAAGTRAFTQMMRGSAALMSLAASRTPGQYFARQAKLANAVSQSALAASALSGSTARLAKRGLAPIHSRATANARRLAKR